jgi:hypothetical protein
MSTTASILAKITTTGSLGEKNELGTSNLITTTTSSSFTSYVFTPGQERNCTQNIISSGSSVIAKYYIIESSAAIDVVVTTQAVDTSVPIIYTHPRGKLFVWSSDALGSTLTSISIKAPATSAANVEVALLLGFSGV